MLFFPETHGEEMNDFKLDFHSTLLVSSDHQAASSRVEGMAEQRGVGYPPVFGYSPFLQDWLYFGKLLHFTEKRRRNRLKLQAAAEVQIPCRGINKGGCSSLFSLTNFLYSSWSRKG